MASGNKYEVDPSNAGYDQTPKQTGPNPNQYNAGYNQPPPYVQQPGGYAQYPAGYAQHPTGYAQQPTGYAQQPTGFGHHTNNTVVVTNNAPGPVIIAAPPRGNDWLVPAILSFFFCCPLVGICAIVAAVNARSNYDCGDTSGGRSSASWAKGLTLTSIGIGVACYILIIVLYATVLKSEEDIINNYGYNNNY
uniref:Proline-rich transmembrane protein 1 n=1 Tax=Magallana gigas TaxID=29159 RepID=A0A8W8LZF4_MAGGI|nr:proline rich transmembrane protein 1B [Crassostrea gigas]